MIDSGVLVPDGFVQHSGKFNARYARGNMILMYVACFGNMFYVSYIACDGTMLSCNVLFHGVIAW